MKALRQFLEFKSDAFFYGKKCAVIESKEWKDFDSKEILGTKVEVVILEDLTDYRPGKDGKKPSNLYEKLTLKVKKKNLDVPNGTLVVPVNPVATVYGDFQNMLSVVADDISIAQQPTTTPGTPARRA